MLSNNINININTNINTDRIAVLPVSYGRESFTLRKERRLRVFENRVLRKILGVSERR
jgi:hypothetical protein